MNPQIAFLQWVKQENPAVLRAAVAKVQRKVAFGGLGDDLISPSSSTDWSGIISAVASAVPTVASSVVQTQAQLATINANAQRAAQGLAPLTAQQLLTGQTGATSTSTLLLVGIGIFAVFALAGSRGGSSAPSAS
jgi:hypothetical protein